MDKIPMTINGYENLQAEIKRLKTTERPQIIAAIAEARKHGDLSGKCRSIMQQRTTGNE